MKSILARYEQIKEKGFSEEDGTQINQITKAFENLRKESNNTIDVKVWDEQKQGLRDYTSVLEDLGKVWGGMTGKQRSMISTVMAGSYQINRFNALMTDFNQTGVIYQETLGAMGSAQTKMATAQESLESKMKLFSNALTDVYTKLVSSGFLGALVDAGTNILKFVASLDPATVGLNALGFVVIANVGKIVELVKVIGSLGAILKTGNIIQFGMALVGMGTSAQIATASLGTMTAVTDESIIAAQGAKLAFTEMQLAMGLVGIALVTITTIITGVNKHYQDLKDTTNELTTAQDSLNKSLSSNNMQGASDAYDSLLSKEKEYKALLEERARLQASQSKTDIMSGVS